MVRVLFIEAMPRRFRVRRPVDDDLGVEPDLAVALDGRRGIEGQGPG
jgi:hypothetical protein